MELREKLGSSLGSYAEREFKSGIQGLDHSLPSSCGGIWVLFLDGLGTLGIKISKTPFSLIPFGQWIKISCF